VEQKPKQEKTAEKSKEKGSASKSSRGVKSKKQGKTLE